MNKFLKFVAAPVASSLLLLQSASAAVPADVTTAMTDMKADALIVAGGFLVALIALAAFKLMRKGT